MVLIVICSLLCTEGNLSTDLIERSRIGWVRIALSTQRLQWLCVGCPYARELQLQNSASSFLGSTRFTVMFSL